ncbi:hypothetical protein [Paenisporosarcina indica]|uniref:hypothetical protein n=1 Tax=Paenisporosarcina indica TaxID=650093 RepID=UPI00094F4EBF|nr:hypothetical protein [Paenisporosarcina indica]
MFTTNTGKAYTPSYLSQYLTEQIEKSDLPFIKNCDNKIGPYISSCTFAIISKINKADLYDITRSLGHEKIVTTMIYLEKIFEMERHAIHSWSSEMLGEYI